MVFLEEGNGAVLECWIFVVRSYFSQSPSNEEAAKEASRGCRIVDKSLETQTQVGYKSLI